MIRPMQGVFIPMITPFWDGRIDIDSYKQLLRLYLEKGVAGFIPLATTGEAPTIEEDEYFRVLETTIETVAARALIYAGISSNSTRKAEHLIQTLNRYSVDGYLITSPYYNLPSQAGIYDHFARLAEATDRGILIYNIPYRTGRNVENETILRLSKLKEIVGIKDSCGNVSQTIELLRERDPAFSVLTGEDVLFYFNIVHGGNGGVLASAHLHTERFLRIHELVLANNHREALAEWNKISGLIPLLFKEPNPAPVKYILQRKGLIRSAEVRAPLAPISEALKRTFDRMLFEKAV